MGAAGCRFVNIGPVRDNLDTGTAVEWIPVRPNTDTAMLLGIAWVLRDKGLHDRAFLTRHCVGWRSEEHTSELQSLMRISYDVFCMKKKYNKESITIQHKQEHTNKRTKVH